MNKQISETLRIDYHEFEKNFWVISTFEQRYNSNCDEYIILDGKAETFEDAIQQIKQYFKEMFENL